MADILKAGARKPRIIKGGCYTGNHYDGEAVSMFYDLTVSNSEASYTSRLSEVEMLQTIQEWLTRYNAHQARVRRDATQRAAIA